MSLYFEPRITGFGPVGRVEVRRVYPHGTTLPAETVGTYEVSLNGRMIGTLAHRYGAGAWVLAASAATLVSTWLENPDHPVSL